MTYELRTRKGMIIPLTTFRDVPIGGLFRIVGDSEVVYMRIDRAWSYISLRSGNAFEAEPDKIVTPLENAYEVVLSRGK